MLVSNIYAWSKKPPPSRMLGLPYSFLLMGKKSSTLPTISDKTNPINEKILIDSGFIEGLCADKCIIFSIMTVLKIQLIIHR